MSNPALQRTVLVTGAARRLGRDIAQALARAGWRVAVHYRDSEQDALETVAACTDLSGDSDSFQADFNDEQAVRALISRVVQRFGRLDAVVNNASLFEHDDAASFGYQAMQAHLLSNTGAPIVLAQGLQEHMRARIEAGEPDARGAVVNLLDQKLWNQNPDFLSYTLSKAALEAAGTMLALALAPLVRVVGVAPGLTLTSHLLSQERFEALHRLSPLGRSSSAADVASAVCFALDNQSMTGTTLLVDGGQHLQRFERDFSLM
ncbi:SDR family oxidoreductase [Comamonas composti]|uniref:SDR family oxidoreductase n=1 Tax=Comamonas composti TaxID=408558 RepID=UPI00047DDABD|nr:SDR family oxidoreductase [Comamonas composti]